MHATFPPIDMSYFRKISTMYNDLCPAKNLSHFYLYVGKICMESSNFHRNTFLCIDRIISCLIKSLVIYVYFYMHLYPKTDIQTYNVRNLMTNFYSSANPLTAKTCI